MSIRSTFVTRLSPMMAIFVRSQQPSCSILLLLENLPKNFNEWKSCSIEELKGFGGPIKVVGEIQLP